MYIHVLLLISKGQPCNEFPIHLYVRGAPSLLVLSAVFYHGYIQLLHMT